MAPRILVPIDDSTTSEETVRAILENRDRFPARLTLLHVVDTEKLAYRMIPDFQVEMIRKRAAEAGKQLLISRRDILREAGLDTETRLEFGAPREVICRLANEEDFQLLIIGRRGMGEIRDVLFGSVANHVLHHVRCPVLLF